MKIFLRKKIMCEILSEHPDGMDAKLLLVEVDKRYAKESKQYASK